MPMDFETRNKFLIDRCKRELADYASGRKAEVDKGRETPEFAALLVQKFGNGMLAVLKHLADVEDTPSVGALDVDEAVASINPEWAAADQRRWAANRVGLVFEMDCD